MRVSHSLTEATIHPPQKVLLSRALRHYCPWGSAAQLEQHFNDFLFLVAREERSSHD
jgi:putative heme iron utilization protein